MCSPTVCLERGTEGSKDSEHYRSIIVTDPTGMASLMHTNAATGTRVSLARLYLGSPELFSMGLSFGLQCFSLHCPVLARMQNLYPTKPWSVPPGRNLTTWPASVWVLSGDPGVSTEAGEVNIPLWSNFFNPLGIFFSWYWKGSSLCLLKPRWTQTTMYQLQTEDHVIYWHLHFSILMIFKDYK